MENRAELPFDLLVLIAKRVKVMEDFTAFGAVCTWWRAAASKENFDVLAPQVPLLMLGVKDDFDYLSKQKVSPIFLPEARGEKCFPTEGWLCTIADTIKGREMNLLHPFSNTQVQLPPLKCLWEILVVHYYFYLAFWPGGDLN
ncbi:hypothetical protein RND71_027144 [Anisodus tanguticus]|uniref:KIB1-4 beta-propeller domain-containing protein n=1 Tax=Anisodus tanguticus TaxID=243964 RepID=A0AAE1RM95_9SOLA|nr:hypothetical protein RND71_027144 [Anisodus tanguticus]